MNEYEFQDDGGGRKKILLYGGIGLVVLVLVGVVLFLVIRNRRAGELQPAGGTPVLNVNGVQSAEGQGAINTPPEPEPTRGLGKVQLDYLAEHPDPPVEPPDVELNVVKTLTPEELQQFGYQPGDVVTYKWIKPENGSAPGRVFLTGPATPSTPKPANWVPSEKPAQKPTAPAPAPAPVP